MTGEWQPTACILCECNCGIVVQLDGRNLARIRGDKAHPASQGYTCNKALRLDHYQNNRNRLTSPMRRRPDGSYEEIDWETAISEIAAGFKHISDTYGGDKIFYYGGGGQGNHLGGVYSGAFLKALGSRYRSNALAQEKTGEAWVDAHLYGGHTRGEFEHAEVSVFVGKNPWMSQSFPRARVVLNEIAKDPRRSMIVIDPVITDTAKMADIHLRVRPGTDAWCLAAMAAVLVQEDLCNETFLAEHVNGADDVREVLRDVPIGAYAQRCGVDEELLRAAARRIASADSVAVFEDLGIQQAPNSTLCSYLNKLLWILTGNFAKHGGQHLHSSFAPLFRASGVGRTPVTGAPIIGGLVPGNVVPQEILSDHPDRFRAMIVESSNPAHSLADSASCRDGVRITGTDGGHRCRDDRNGSAGPLRSSGGHPIREARSHLLQSRVPAQHFSPAPSSSRAAPGHAGRAGDLGAAGPRSRHRRRRRAAAASRRRESRAATHTRRRSPRNQRQPDGGQTGAIRAVRNARADVARWPCRRGSVVGACPEDGTRLSRRRFVAPATTTATHFSTRSCRTVRELPSPCTTTRTTSI